MIQFQPTKWEGLEGMGDAELAKLRPIAAKAVGKAARHFMNAVKKTLTGTRTGRLYKVTKRGRLHQASAPGEPPAVLFGQLRNSITFSEPKWDGWLVFSEVGTALKKARRLEWGGVDRRGVRILPRPYFEPTAQRELPTIERILAEAVA